MADADRLHVTVTATGLLTDDAQSGAVDSTYRRTLIEALIPGATFVEEQDRSIVTCTVSSV